MKELADYKQEILRKTELLREKVAERLADEAKSGFSGAIVDELILKGGQTSPRYAQVDVSVDNRGSVKHPCNMGCRFWLSNGRMKYPPL